MKKDTKTADMIISHPPYSLSDELPFNVPVGPNEMPKQQTVDEDGEIETFIGNPLFATPEEPWQQVRLQNEETGEVQTFTKAEFLARLKEDNPGYDPEAEGFEDAWKQFFPWERMPAEEEDTSAE